MEDLKEHIGTVLAISAGMWGVIVILAGVIWRQLREESRRFPEWLTEVNKQGGIVTSNRLHDDLKAHDEAYNKFVTQVTVQIATSEQHQKDVLDRTERHFKDLIEGQGKLISRLQEIQNMVMENQNQLRQDMQNVALAINKKNN
jgi:uncharacterized protein YaaR (DUF327 family)